MAQSPALHLVCLGTKWIPIDGSGKTDHHDDPAAHAKTPESLSMSRPLMSAHPVQGHPSVCACVGHVYLNPTKKLKQRHAGPPFHE